MRKLVSIAEFLELRKYKGLWGRVFEALFVAKSLLSPLTLTLSPAGGRGKKEGRTSSY
jgi:hypothetical protein